MDLLALLAEVEAELAAGIVPPERPSEAEARKAASLTQARKLHPCPRCWGRGVLDLYRHVADGVCFDCNGSGTTLEIGWLRK